MSRRRPSVTAVALTVLGLAILGLAGCGTALPSSSGAPADGAEDELVVYAAASLAASFDEIAAAFTAENPGIRITPVYDGSATLATQLAGGAPADVFAAADEASMAQVSTLIEEPALFATNTLVVAVPAGNPGRVRTVADLADVTTVLCAPDVPCGAASTALLDLEGVRVDAASLEQNVTAVLTKIETGEADAGLVYATDVRDRPGVEVIVPDRADEVVNRYPIAALADAGDPEAAADFVAFVRSDAGREILTAHGFGSP